MVIDESLKPSRRSTKYFVWLGIITRSLFIGSNSSRAIIRLDGDARAKLRSIHIIVAHQFGPSANITPDFPYLGGASSELLT